MDKEAKTYDFDDIRPLNNDEVAEAIESLIASERFRHALRYITPDLDWEAFCRTMRSCKTKEEFKATFGYGAVMKIAKATTFSLTISGRSRLPGNSACTFISNHRDIVLDAGFLNVLLYDIGYMPTQIAIGDNLLIHPWIKTVVRLNNSFIVKRHVSGREILAASKKLSAYIHHTISRTNESLWIAQREGRAKDSNDYTQSSVLKMLSMGGTADFLGNLKALNIVPISISYEIDPCDYLKAKEFQQKRDIPDFVKSQRDDLLNMETGILENKGRVHFTICRPINPMLDRIDPTLDKNELTAAVADIIDREIYANYRFYPRNYVAYDLLNRTMEFRAHYDQRDRRQFEAYLEQQINRIDLPNKDELFLRTKILEMYANPLKNHLRTRPANADIDAALHEPE